MTARPPPGDAEARLTLQACGKEDRFGDRRDQNEMAIRFARLCGTDPEGVGDAEFQRELAMSAVTAVTSRMQGIDAQEDARERFLAQFRRFGPAWEVETVPAGRTANWRTAN